MYPYPPDYDNNRRLVRTAQHEAIDLNTGDKYRLEKMNPDANFSFGAVFGLVIGILLFALLSQEQAPEAPPPLSPTSIMLPTQQ